MINPITLHLRQGKQTPPGTASKIANINANMNIYLLHKTCFEKDSLFMLF